MIALQPELASDPSDRTDVPGDNQPDNSVSRILREDMVHLDKASSKLPSGVKRVSSACIRRWADESKQPHLEVAYIGRTPYTSREALERFIVAQNASRSTVIVPTAAQSKSRARAADAELDKLL